MHLSVRSGLSFLCITVLMILLLPGAAAGKPGLGEKLGFGKNKKGENADDEARSASQPPPAGMRRALLISVPIHEATIPERATVAFIAFNHIEHRLQSAYSISSRTETSATQEGLGSTRKSSEFRDEAYTNDICAAQIEYALAQHLADLNRFKVVTREHIHTLLDEQRFNYSGSVNTTTAIELGELLGVNILVYGQVQLCVSNRMNLAAAQDVFSSLLDSGMLGSDESVKMAGGFWKMFKNPAKEDSEKLRAFVLAQIQLIETKTGQQVFTTSLAGEYEATRTELDFEMSHRELVARAADDLANSFIDKFLARREDHQADLHAGAPWGFDRGIDLIHLGDCRAAEEHFAGLYDIHRGQMNGLDAAKLMHNHGIALMCSNRQDEALARLWASLRLSYDDSALRAIELTHDTIDRGRRILGETDSIIEDLRSPLYRGNTAFSSRDESPELGGSESGAEPMGEL